MKSSITHGFKLLFVSAKLTLWLIRGTRNLRRVKWVKRFLRDYSLFLNSGGKVTQIRPIIYDFAENAGSAKGAYFHQDLLVANKIFHAKPKRHIDVGSRIDGFTAHVASYREIEVLDVRTLPDPRHHSIRFLQADLMDEATVSRLRSDSVSCLHALEHFGLGRYSDPINPDGHKIGFNNLLKILELKGLLYIGVPVGLNNAVYFNSHRVFHPKDILSWASNPDEVELVSFDYVDDKGELHLNYDLRGDELYLKYGLGIYTFRKVCV